MVSFLVGRRKGRGRKIKIGEAFGQQLYAHINKQATERNKCFSLIKQLDVFCYKKIYLFISKLRLVAYF